MAYFKSRVTPLLFAGFLSLPVEAAEVCVSCSGPDASYRCAYEGSTVTAPEPSLPLVCLSELSKIGKHESCTVERKIQQPCQGPLKLITRPPGDKPPPAAVEAPEAAAPAPAPRSESGPATPEAVPDTSPEASLASRGKTRQPDKAAVPEPAPRTVKEMVDKSSAAAQEKKEGQSAGKSEESAAEKTESALSKAGGAVTEAAKKTWKCVTSLFGDC